MSRRMPVWLPEAVRQAAESSRGSSGLRLRVLVIGLVSLSLTLGAVFGKRGLLERLRYQREHRQIQADIAALETEVAALDAEVRSLREGSIALERIAREELTLALPGEKVVLLGTGERDPRRQPRPMPQVEAAPRAPAERPAAPPRR